MHFYLYLYVHMAIANIIPGFCVAAHSSRASSPATKLHEVCMTLEDLRDKDPLLGQGFSCPTSLRRACTGVRTQGSSWVHKDHTWLLGGSVPARMAFLEHRQAGTHAGPASVPGHSTDTL